MGVKDYDLNPDNNTQINGINIAEGCPPSGINNAMRQLMADVKEDSDAQSEALKKFSETPASAEELGPVKVGDGLTMGEDGTLSADLATAEAAGRVKASTTAQAGAVPVAKEDGTLDLSWLGLLNTRLIITESTESWTPPVTGWVRVTVIGGGGAGTSVVNKVYRSGSLAGTTTFRTLSANGGRGYSTDGSLTLWMGGAAGEVVTEYVYLDKNTAISVTIGAGGIAGNSNTGQSGYDIYPGYLGSYSSSGDTYYGSGGNGASNGTAFGGGGGGIFAPNLNYSMAASSRPGMGAGGGKDASKVSGSFSSTGSYLGGDGGQGAIIIEYYDPEKEAV